MGINAPPPERQKHCCRWFLTFGTYGTRLHGDPRLSVAKNQNVPGTPFVPPNPLLEDRRRSSMKGEPIWLSDDQAKFVEEVLPQVVRRGGWTLRTCSAASNHVHAVIFTAGQVDGDPLQRLVKRWLTESLTERFGPPQVRWWASGGSAIPLWSDEYCANAIDYVHRQRAMPPHRRDGSIPGMFAG